MEVQLYSITKDCIVEGDRLRWHLIGYDKEGREYTHVASFDRFLSEYAAERLLNRIKEAGLVINIEHWHERTPYGSEAWLIDGMEYRQIEDERMGLG